MNKLNYNKGIAPFIILLVVALLAGGGAVYYKKSAPKTGDNAVVSGGPISVGAYVFLNKYSDEAYKGKDVTVSGVVVYNNKTLRYISLNGDGDDKKPVALCEFDNNANDQSAGKYNKGDNIVVAGNVAGHPVGTSYGLQNVKIMKCKVAE